MYPRKLILASLLCTTFALSACNENKPKEVSEEAASAKAPVTAVVRNLTLAEPLQLKKAFVENQAGLETGAFTLNFVTFQEGKAIQNGVDLADGATPLAVDAAKPYCQLMLAGVELPADLKILQGAKFELLASDTTVANTDSMSLKVVGSKAKVSENSFVCKNLTGSLDATQLRAIAGNAITIE